MWRRERYSRPTLKPGTKGSLSRPNMPCWTWCGRMICSTMMNLTIPLKEALPSAMLSAVACYGTRLILSWKCGSQRQNHRNRLRLPRVAQVTTTKVTTTLIMAAMATIMLAVQAAVLNVARIPTRATQVEGVHRATKHRLQVVARAPGNVLLC